MRIAVCSAAVIRMIRSRPSGIHPQRTCIVPFLRQNANNGTAVGCNIGSCSPGKMPILAIGFGRFAPRRIPFCSRCAERELRLRQRRKGQGQQQGCAQDGCQYLFHLEYPFLGGLCPPSVLVTFYQLVACIPLRQFQKVPFTTSVPLSRLSSLPAGQVNAQPLAAFFVYGW